MTQVRLSVVAIGGAHQALHFIPLVLKLAQRGRIAPEIFARPDQEAALKALAANLDLPLPPVTLMTLPWAVAAVDQSKAMRLIWWSRRLRSADAILSAERTSTLLKRLPGHCPPFIHIPHGAGDRAKGFEPRMKWFDKVLVSGEKDRDRIVDLGLLPQGAVEVLGSVKLAALAQTPALPPLFADNRPIILYNPHFSARFGTFEQVAQRLIGEVVADGRYNLIVAPHVRLAEQMTEADRRFWEGQSQPGVIVDLGSTRSIDMTYTRCSDIYVCDVSSQIYEALAARRRPCLFLNRGVTDWEDDPDFAMWRFGPVVDCREEVLPGVDMAVARFAEFRGAQDAGIARAYANSHPAPGQLDAMADQVEELIVSLAASDRSRRSRSRYR
ncbi:glycosyl transferase [Croceicoccus sp. BE223]|uniref:glycosyl transferase n=1 Tax=Croceicoccus sp. BE223 TaxID=2817716 RepID=UPI00285A1071|nr:glycosyl transferase [Croceicoccus sp. BE223]MDR7103393.1 hypothetical protein [Croceicoccus sp. BE223]